MPVPAALKTAGSWIKNNPESWPLLTSAVSSLYRFIRPDRQRELQKDVLESQTQFQEMLARQAFGNFSAAERQQIAAAAEPQVNQVAANVSSRGLGTSGAGAQIIAQAQQRPFEVAQQQAMQALSGANATLLQGSQYLLDDNSFFDDIVAIAKLLRKRHLKNDTSDALVQDSASALFTTVMGQGYQPPETAAHSQLSPFLKPDATLDSVFGR